MHDIPFRQEGAITYWECPPSLEYKTLQSLLAKHKLSQHISRHRDLNEILGHALEAYVSARSRRDKHYRVDPRNDKPTGYAVYTLFGRVEGLVNPVPDTNSFIIQENRGNLVHGEIEYLLDEEFKVIRPAELNRILCSVIIELGGNRPFSYSRRSTTSSCASEVYYISEEGLDAWVDIAKTLESLNGNSKFCVIRPSFDIGETRSAIEGIKQEVESLSACIEKVCSEMHNPRLQEHVLSNMLNRVRKYRDMISDCSASLVEIAEQAEFAVAMRQAAIIAAEGDSQERSL